MTKSIESDLIDYSTTDGRATVVVKGGAHSGPAQLRFKVGEVEQILDLVVNPLTIQLQASETVYAGDSTDIELTVTDINGVESTGLGFCSRLKSRTAHSDLV